MKQAQNELAQVTTALSAAFSDHHSALTGADPCLLLPQSMPELEALLPVLSERAQAAQRGLADQKREMGDMRSQLAANDALAQQHAGQLQQLRQRSRGLEGKLAEVQSCIETLLALGDDPLLNDHVDKADWALTAASSLQQVVKVANDVYEASTINEAILMAFHKVFKRLGKARSKRPQVCPCCEQGMDAAVEQVYEANIFKFTDRANYERAGNFLDRQVR